MELDNGYSVIWHFGMSGKIKICDGENLKLEKHDHVMIKTTRGVIVYNDPRRFGVVTYCKSDKISENPLLCHLGLDPFSDNLTVSYLKNKLSGKRIPIKIALLDQTIVSGIGNIYASEALYLAHISPLRESQKINSKELLRLIEAIREVLTNAIKAGGSTLHDYRLPNGDIGYFQLQHAVYGKEGQKCPQCIAPHKKCQGILKLVQGGRSTFYCPHWQK
jgi:formamidopyrimidine-DNA glycosylase